MKLDKRSIDIEKIPFSRFGSYFVISSYKSKLYIRDVRGGDLVDDKLFEFNFAESVTILMTEVQLTLIGRHGSLHITFNNEDTLMFKGNLKFKLKLIQNKYDSICQLDGDLHEITSYSKDIKVAIKREKGTLNIFSPWDKVGNTKVELACEHYYQFYMCSYKTVYSEGIITNKTLGYTFDFWQSILPNDKTHAAYITWMNFVKPEGHNYRYAMLMSKNWMTNIWSWDNCFSAIFLSHIDSDLALDQYLLFSDHQDRSGMYPDFINDRFKSYACAKPPVYGWAYQMMTKINPVFDNITLLEKVFDTISKFTNFWLNYRMSDFGLPYYIHGNESGWDNGTFFRKGVPVITPDLSSLLIRQLDFLSEIAFDLGMRGEQKRLKTIADELFENMMKYLWKDERFMGYYITDKQYIDGRMTLQSLLPLMIHYRLTDEVKENLLNQLKEENHFLTPYGFATESLKSTYYESNGYWRGPIWAPVMLMITSVLDEMNEISFSKDVTRRFVDCLTENGMAENFDAKKGKGLVDPAFAWTSSVYLHYLFENDFLEHES